MSFLIQTVAVPTIHNWCQVGSIWSLWHNYGRSKTIALAVKRALRAQVEGYVRARVVLTREQLAAALESGEAYTTDLGDVLDRTGSMRLDVM